MTCIYTEYLMNILTILHHKLQNISYYRIRLIKNTLKIYIKIFIKICTITIFLFLYNGNILPNFITAILKIRCKICLYI